MSTYQCCPSCVAGDQCENQKPFIEPSVPAKNDSCPCAHTTPCHDGCTCVHQFSSSGCRRCCSFGAPEQQQAMAEHLALVWAVYEAAKELHEVDRIECGMGGGLKTSSDELYNAVARLYDAIDAATKDSPHAE